MPESRSPHTLPEQIQEILGAIPHECDDLCGENIFAIPHSVACAERHKSRIAHAVARALTEAIYGGIAQGAVQMTREPVPGWDTPIIAKLEAASLSALAQPPSQEEK